MLLTKEYWIEKLNLKKHPEGGFYRETYRSLDEINQDQNLFRYDGKRQVSTAIYYLLSGEEFSAFHQLKSDEIFHFYYGSSLNVYLINSQGKYQEFILGNNPENDEVLQLVIPHGCWFASNVTDSHSYSLIGCTVAPAFDFNDFKLGERDELIKLYPQHREIISRFTIH